METLLLYTPGLQLSTSRHPRSHLSSRGSSTGSSKASLGRRLCHGFPVRFNLFLVAVIGNSEVKIGKTHFRMIWPLLWRPRVNKIYMHSHSLLPHHSCIEKCETARRSHCVHLAAAFLTGSCAWVFGIILLYPSTNNVYNALPYKKLNKYIQISRTRYQRFHI